MREKLIDFYLGWISGELTYDEYAKANGLDFSQTRELILIGQDLYFSDLC